MTDHYVYVKDATFHWVPGVLTDTTNDSATVTVTKYQTEAEIKGSHDGHGRTKSVVVRLADYPNSALPLQNVVGGEAKEVADMIELSFLHEASILFNLKARHFQSTPYTRTGDIVIAVNPYKWFPALYTEQNRGKYSRALVWESGRRDYDPRLDLAPHVYETSALSYKGLSIDGINQCILVSGESGAGKTETVKICMNHLASVVQQEHKLDGDSGQDQRVITRVLDSNPLLEAFGNAKTRRNDNSSRFGKFIQLQFERGKRNSHHLTLVGSFCQVYLLEKSRVVRHDQAERTFHIFYQLLAAPNSVKSKFWKRLENSTYASFAYVGDTDMKSIEGVPDRDRFKMTLDSLAIIGIEGDLLQTMMQAICVVLQLGNIVFGPDPKDSDRAVITSTEELSHLAGLMGIPVGKIGRTLTHRVVKVRKEETRVPLSPEAAKDSADALAKQIYEALFLWLVREINKATRSDQGEAEGSGLIGLLDIFGFECFPVNSFEQLCINYANERLQQKFTQDVFVSVFEEYKEEGITLDEIDYDDNTHVLDLIQNRTGLLAMLNEECIRPNGSDCGFVNKAIHSNKRSPALITPRIVRSNVEFGIRHYAGDVMYDATDFVVKNQDSLPVDLARCARASSNDIISKELLMAAPLQQAKRTGNLAAATVWSKYRGQLVQLMEDLHKAQSRYIRCIKPNSMKRPRVMEHGMTLQQLRSSGVISAVTLARSAFPNRLEHCIVLERFHSLWTSIARKKSSSAKDDCETLLGHALKLFEKGGKKGFVIGKTRAYFRAGTLEYLEAARLKAMERPATRIQAIVRAFLAKIRVQRISEEAKLQKLRFHIAAAVTIQKIWRRHAAKALLRKLRKHAKARARKAREEKRKRRAAVRIQCLIRVYLARREAEKRSVQKIKDHARAIKQRKMLKKQGTAAIKIQRIMRGAYIRLKYKRVLEKVHERISIKEKIQKLKRKIAKTEKAREKELDKARNGIDTERAGRDVWEESVMAATDEVVKSETAKMVEYLQGEHRKLQIKTKTLDGMIKPLKKNFEALVEENKTLREEFVEIQKKNDELKASNKDLVAQRDAAEEKKEKLKAELKSVSNRFLPMAHGKLDFQKALSQIVEMMEARCTDEQLVEDVSLLSFQCQAESQAVEAGVKAGRRGDSAGSSKAKGKTVGGSLPASKSSKLQSPGSKKRRETLNGSLTGLGSLGAASLLAPVSPLKKRNTLSLKGRKK